MKVLLQQPTDQSIGQRMGESHLPGQYLDIALILGQYLDNYIALGLVAGQCKIYWPAKAIDLPTQSVT